LDADSEMQAAKMLKLIFTGLIECYQRKMLDEANAGQQIAIAENSCRAIASSGDGREPASKVFFHAHGADADGAGGLVVYTCSELRMA
jgi:hypothetical protein